MASNPQKGGAAMEPWRTARDEENGERKSRHTCAIIKPVV